MRAPCILLAVLALLAAGPCRAAAPPPQVYGEAVILVDVQSGRVLFHKNSRSPRAVASTQKLLTALIVAEDGNLDAPVTIQRFCRAGWSPSGWRSSLPRNVSRQRWRKPVPNSSPRGRCLLPAAHALAAARGC